ncbi:unnamed protein product [Schistosoma rodhaini]|uniref:ARID domain-containing protein n=1 Tax=Schistosoma rodhaini TaxID=6188 RepID=A0AA85FHF1_9TREM|nr:unnamed protein product [Schistosoma rodhaini]
MYGKNKSVGIPSDAQSKEKLAVYVYEYLVHIGAQKTANSFLQEIRWDKSISVGEPPGFLHSWWSVFWDLYSAAPERRDTHEHSSEAKAFHDYGFVNSGYPNGLPHSSDHQPSGSGMSGHPHHPTPPHYMGGQPPPQQQTPPSSNSCLPPEYAARPSPHLVFSGGGPGSTPDNGMFGTGPGCSDSGLLNGSVGPPRSSGMMPPPPPDYSSGMPSSTSNPYPPGSDLKASPLHGGPGMGCDMVSPAGGPPPLMPSDYPSGNGPGGNGPGQSSSGFPGDSVMMMPPPQQQSVLQQHMGGGPQGQAPPPPQYVPSGGQHSGSGGGPPSSMQSVCGGSNPSPAGGPGSVQFPQEYSFSQMS